GECLEVVTSWPQFETALDREIARSTRRKARMCVDARAHRRAAECETLQAAAALHDARARMIDLRVPAAHLLAERQRHRIHQVRAPGLDDVANVADAATDHRTEVCERRQQVLLDGEQCAQV